MPGKALGLALGKDLGKDLGIDLAARAPSSVPPVLDGLTATAVGAYSMLRKLRTAYAGPAFRVRRASDNAEADIGFVGNDTDLAALLAFCAGTSGFLKTWHDQGTVGRHWSQMSATLQPRVVNAGALETMTGGKFAWKTDGGDDRLTLTVGLGMTGDTPITTCWVNQFYSADATAWSFGTIAQNQAWNHSPYPPYLRLDYAGATGSYRDFVQVANVATSPCRYIAQRAAGAQGSQIYLEQNDTVLAEYAGHFRDGGTLALGSTGARLGVLGNDAAGTFASQHMSVYIYFASILSAPDHNAVRAELARHA